MQDFEKGVSDVQSRDVIEMMMITQYFDMLKVNFPTLNHAMRQEPCIVLDAQCTAAAHGLRNLVSEFYQDCGAQDVGSKNATIFVPSNPGHVGDLSAEVLFPTYLSSLGALQILLLHRPLSQGTTVRCCPTEWHGSDIRPLTTQMRNGFLQGMAGRQEMKRE